MLGKRRLTIVDPASPWEDEQGRLLAALRDDAGEVERIFLTHHHHDHVAGALALREALGDVPIVAHPITASLLEGVVPVQELLDEGDQLVCDEVQWDVMHTPGHAPGHLVLQESDTGIMVAGDMVAGTGTILIAPGDGDLGLYLTSLERMRERAPSTLLPSHGPSLAQAEAVLGFYVAHRHQRTQQIHDALHKHGPARSSELVPRVYADLDVRAWPVAEVQICAHLAWMHQHGLVVAEGGRWRALQPS